MTVAVVVVVIDEEEVKTPADVIVPADVGATDQTTAWDGLFAPALTDESVMPFPAVTAPVEGLTVTEVTVVVVPPPPILSLPLLPQPASPASAKTIASVHPALCPIMSSPSGETRPQTLQFMSIRTQCTPRPRLRGP